MPATFTVKQVAEILGYSTNSIYSFLKAKRIKGVRVGKGRFRIPQSELDRLLLVKNTPAKGISLPQSPIVVSEHPYVASVDLSATPASYSSDTFVDPLSAHAGVEVPSLFDWFVGVGAIIVGFAMFLFSNAYEEFAVSSAASWVSTIQTIFIASGFGLLLSDIAGKKSAPWTKIFRLVLAFTYGLYAVVSVMNGTTDVGVLFGLAVPLLVLSFNSSVNGVKLFVAYSTAISLYLFSTTLLRTGWVVLPEVVRDFSGLLIGTLLVSSFFLYQLINKSNRMLQGGVVLLSVFLITSSLHYASQMMWGRALYILMAAICTIFAPIWKTLAFTHKRDRAFVFGVIGSLLLVFVFVIGFIRIMQSNTIAIASRELDNKVVYGKVSVESALESAKSSLNSLSVNPIFIDALESNKTTTLIDLSKTIVGINSSLRRVVVASKDGAISATYPYTEEKNTSVQGTDYFTRVQSSKQMIISDVFEVVTDDAKRKVVVIAIPVMSKKSELLGVLAGYLDIDGIGMKLQQLSSESIGEYAVVVDKHARLIIHPDNSYIGVEVEDQDPLRMGLSGKRGVSDMYKSRGVNVLTAVDLIGDNSGWVIAMRVPLFSVLRMAETSVTVLVFLMVVSSSIIAVFFFSHRKRSTLSPSDTFVGQKGDSS